MILNNRQSDLFFRLSDKYIKKLTKDNKNIFFCKKNVLCSKEQSHKTLFFMSKVHYKLMIWIIKGYKINLDIQGKMYS